MYQGKYQKPLPKRKHRRKSSILVISLVLLLVAVVGGTAAYLMDATNPVENTFTPVKVDVEIKEDFQNNLKKDVSIHNKSDTKVYIRVTLVENWKNAAGEIVPAPTPPSFDWGGWKDATDPDWFEVNGIFYYEKALDPQSDAYVTDDTSNLIDQVTVTLPEGYTYNLNIFAEAIQAEPADAVEEAWTDVNVSDGKLVPASSTAG